MFETVQDLLDFLKGVPPETPIAANYDGTGRISGLHSYSDGAYQCIALYEDKSTEADREIRHREIRRLFVEDATAHMER